MDFHFCFLDSFFENFFGSPEIKREENVNKKSYDSNYHSHSLHDTPFTSIFAYSSSTTQKMFHFIRQIYSTIFLLRDINQQMNKRSKRELFRRKRKHWSAIMIKYFTTFLFLELLLHISTLIAQHWGEEAFRLVEAVKDQLIIKLSSLDSFIVNITVYSWGHNFYSL